MADRPIQRDLRAEGSALSLRAAGEARKPDLTYSRTCSLFTLFVPETPAGEAAFEVLARETDGTGKVPHGQVPGTLQQLRAAGYTARKAAPRKPMSAAELEAALADLDALVPPASRSARSGGDEHDRPHLLRSGSSGGRADPLERQGAAQRPDPARGCHVGRQAVQGPQKGAAARDQEGIVSSMVDRVAVAISGAPFPTASSRRKARAAIAAMETPTEEMEVAGQEEWMCEAAAEDRSGRNWRAMIAAALNEGGRDGP